MDGDRKAELLVDMFPELSAELEQLLRVSGKPALAEQTAGLRVLDRSRCGDDFCATFYTQPKPKGSYGPGLQTVALEPITGHLGGAVAQIEVLYRQTLIKNSVGQ
jgi:hypothetical protein